jgi:ABC-2 type transport system ATP-binding protein
MGERQENVITVSDVTHVYGGRYRALSGVSFSASFENGIFSILGPNGAGKTTLVNLMTTSIKLQRGRISVLGLDVRTERRRIRDMISLCPQELELDVMLSVRTNLWSYGLIRGMRKSLLRSRMEELLEIFELTEKGNKRVMELSGGEMRRVQLMRALLDPSAHLIFIDEPTLGLDPVGKRRTWELIREMADEGYLFLLTTNDMAEVESLSHEILFINGGRTVLKTTVREFKRVYAGRKKVRVERGEALERWVRENPHRARWYDEDTVEVFNADDLYDLLTYLSHNKVPVGELMVEDESLLDGFINLVRGGGDGCA